MVILVEDEDADVDIGVEGGGAQVKCSHRHVVHLVADGIVPETKLKCARNKNPTKCKVEKK